jgi:FLVCR family feline leukemia virus subgroup C receptor-related protein
MTGYLPIGFEFGAELTFPTPEGTQSGLLNASAQVFGVIMVQSMGELMTHVSVFACNASLCLALAAGALITGASLHKSA